jgi:choline dehydrogenase-like flavoprotein
VSEHYDVIIVGTGAGGGTLAHTLAPSGKRILLLERGDFLYVVDTSFFPSIGAVNPALTAMANAIRVGEHLLSRMS